MSTNDSQAANTSGLITYQVLIEGSEIDNSFGVLSISVSKEVNKIASATIEVRDGSTTGMKEDFKVSNSNLFNPGKKIEIKAGYDSDNKTLFKGVVIKHSLKIKKGASYITVDCKDEAIAMTVGRKSAVFVERKDSDIIAEVLKSYPSLDKDIDDTEHEHPEVIQHYVSDWDFILMRADINGMTVVTDNGKLVIKEPDLKAEPGMNISYGQGMLGFQGGIDARTQLPNVYGRAWDNSKQERVTTTSGNVSEVPQGNIKSSDLAKVVGLDNFTLQTPANVPMKALERWAKAKHLKAAMSKIQGKVQFKGVDNIGPGNMLEIGGVSDQFNGAGYVGGVEHRIEGGDWVIDAKLGASPEWYSESTPNVESSPSAGLFPSIKGLHAGKVAQIHDDADGQYRIKVSLPALEKDNLTVWARLSNFYATGESGLFLFPEIGDEVVVGFLNEDPQNPIILGSMYSSVITPPYTPEENNYTKAFVTKGQLKIEFDDEKKITVISTPGGNVITMDDDQKTIIIEDQPNKNKVTMSSAGIALETDTDVKITAKGNIIMEADGNIEAKAKGDVKTEGTNVTNKGRTKFSAEGAQAELKGSAQTTVKGGTVMIN